MSRFLVVLLVIAAFASRDVRERVRPHVQWMLDPVFEWSTGPELNDIANAIETARVTSHGLPASDEELHAFLRSHYHEEGAELDAWGTPYFLTRERAGVRVRSAGRDLSRDTPDDIASRVVRYASAAN